MDFEAHCTKCKYQGKISEWKDVEVSGIDHKECPECKSIHVAIKDTDCKIYLKNDKIIEFSDHRLKDVITTINELFNLNLEFPEIIIKEK